MGNLLNNSGATHRVSVKTGDKKNAGTDGNVYAKMKGEGGTWTEEHLLDKWWKDDLERGHTDHYEIREADIEKVTDICIRRDESRPDDGWYLEKVEIEHLATGKLSVFPVTRWLSAKDELYISEFDSCLPQDDKYKDQRAKELQYNRDVYELEEKVPGLPPKVKKFPDDENFSGAYQLQVAKLSMYAKTKYIDLTTSSFQTLDDFDQIYRHDVLHLPKGQKNWRDDEEFGNQRLSGVNPVSLQICSEIPKDFAVTPDTVERFLEGKTLAEAMTLKKIYMVDLRYLAELKIVGGQYQVCGPIAMFYVKNNKHMIPIAIQLMPKPAEDNPVFVPDDPEFTWHLAKMYFNLADSSHQQSVNHFGFTHLIMESAVVCVRRSMSPSHPLVRLMAPHFLYLLATNKLADSKLINEGGWIDQVMQIHSSGMFEIIAHNWAHWNFSQHGNLRKDLKRRGVDDSEALPNYHYRDDALLLWDAIWDYVSTVVNSVYDTPEKLSGDWELQGWAKELQAAKFVGARDHFGSTDEVIEVVAVMIFTSSVEHAAANFGQYDEYGFPPNYPVKLSGERPKDKTALSESHVVQCLQSKKETLDILIVTHILSQRGTNELANFELQYAYDPICLNSLKQFKTDLEEIGKTIDSRNAQRLRKYPYLHPKDVPNAISI